MEHDSSRSGYHEPEPDEGGQQGDEGEDWGDDYAKRFSVNLIWAQARDRRTGREVIGFKGSMPWKLPEDLRHFMELTVSHPIIMGRKTWESIPEAHRPLPQRDNIVISRDAHYRAAGATVVENIEAALDLARQEAIPDDGIDRSEIWVIGGAQIFHLALPFAERAYVTQIDKDVEGDAFAPDMVSLEQAGLWRVEEATDWMHPHTPDEGLRAYRYIVYVKNTGDSTDEE